ncbi:hypothetical protein [Blautia sp. OF03-15BH]|uniref:hypothetical protein n=1 Tax=Blautia sp. OF03-15BH TaxID=2292287 RepID=UPI0011C10013|nr:hypothetical protein [Blautia sp. OF03-15BH]
MNQLKEVVNAVLEQQKLQLAPSTYDARKNYLKHLVDKEAGTKALTPEGKLYNEPKISLSSEADEIFKNLSFPVKDGRIDTGHLIRRAEKEMTYLNLSTSTRWQYM